MKEDRIQHALLNMKINWQRPTTKSGSSTGFLNAWNAAPNQAYNTGGTYLFFSQGKGKVHVRTGHKGPKG